MEVQKGSTKQEQTTNEIVPVITEIKDIGSLVYVFRGKQVMIDSDLAMLYQVETKNLNKAATRNADRFPEDFRFKLTKEEFDGLRYQSGTSNEEQGGRGGRRYYPYPSDPGMIYYAITKPDPKKAYAKDSDKVAELVFRKVVNGEKKTNKDQVQYGESRYNPFKIHPEYICQGIDTMLKMTMAAIIAAGAALLSLSKIGVIP